MGGVVSFTISFYFSFFKAIKCFTRDFDPEEYFNRAYVLPCSETTHLPSFFLVLSEKKNYDYMYSFCREIYITRLNSGYVFIGYQYVFKFN